LIALWRRKILAAIRSDFGRNTLWVAALSVAERVIAVVQTIVIARALGITDYGVYGLLFGTIGFVASVLGLQMGLTATVYLARYRLTEKDKAAAVLSLSNRFAWTVAIFTIVACVPFSDPIAHWLLQSEAHSLAVVIGIVFVAASILSGVQDGVAQGFELFVPLAVLKMAAGLFTLALVAVAAVRFGLDGVLLAMLIGMLAKYALLQSAIRARRSAMAIPRRGSGVTLRSLVIGFSIPSMLVSLAMGYVTWQGMLWLSRQTAGFDDVAIANAALQWRGPVLLLASALGGVAIPTFSRMKGAGNESAAKSLRRNLLMLNAVVAFTVVLALVLASGLVLGLYGAKFVGGQLAFCIVALSTVPGVLAGVYQQELVGAGRMWRQLWWQLPSVLAMLAALFLLIPTHRANGYAVGLLIGATVLWGGFVAANALDKRRGSRLGNEPG